MQLGFVYCFFFFFSSRRRHTRLTCDWSSDVCSSDLFTLAVRLFANMFAGHMLLLVFSLGATYLFTVGGLSYVFGGISFLMAIVMTFFELLVIFLQAYVFTVLMGTYLNGSIEAEHCASTTRPHHSTTPRQPPGGHRATTQEETPSHGPSRRAHRLDRLGRLRPRRHRPGHR